MSQSGDVLERFHKALVQQIRDTRPEYLTAPFTVAEIYQELVPYRSHRDLIGVEMNGDYEDALFRMLCGEGDYLLLDSEVARWAMQKELDTPNPNTALFREFAAADVRFHPSRVPPGAGPGIEVPSEVSEANVMDQEEAGPRAAEATPAGADPQELWRSEPGRSGADGVVGHIEITTASPLAPSEEPASDAAVSTDAGPSDVLTVCHWCREALPACDSINFCPFCGSDLCPSPCRECGEAMEARWQFCVSCGADVRG